MSRAMYAETLNATPRAARADERAALTRLAGMIKAAEASGPGSRQAVEAIDAVNTIWSALLVDLVRPENDLPVDLRARLVSIGIFLLRHAEAIRKGQSEDFGALREITLSIAEGLA
jgi:flagellar biosynthesis activator protein FlaF